MARDAWEKCTGGEATLMLNGREWVKFDEQGYSVDEDKIHMLGPGTYRISVQMPGFKQARVAKVRVEYGLTGRNFDGDASGGVTVTLDPSFMEKLNRSNPNQFTIFLSGCDQEGQTTGNTGTGVDAGLVTFSLSSNDCRGKNSFENASINVDGNPVVIREGKGLINLGPGAHRVDTLRVPDNPDAKMTGFALTAGGPGAPATVDSDSFTLILSDTMLAPGVKPSVEIFTVNACVTRIKGFVIPVDCDTASIDYKNLTLRVDEQSIPVQDDGTFSEFPIRTGRQQLSIYSNNFPIAKAGHVTVSAYSKDEGKYVDIEEASGVADVSGTVIFPLQDSYWKDNVVPLLIVGVKGLCRAPSGGKPDDFGLARVIEVRGEAYQEIESFGHLSSPESDKPKPIRLGIEKGKRYYGHTVLVTGKGGMVKLESEYGHKITIKTAPNKTSTRVRLSSIMRASRRVGVAYIKNGQVQDQGNHQQPGFSIETKNVKATPKGTDYTVTYDEETDATTVGVAEGEVEVTPTNASLQSFVLTAGQQVEVGQNGVGAVTTFRPDIAGGAARILLYAGTGLAVALAAVLAAVFLYRRRRTHSGHGGRTDGFVISMTSGRVLQLGEGVKLSAEDILGLDATSADGAFAAVEHNPGDPTILGLENLTRRAWSATVPGSGQRHVEPGRSVRLAGGTTINFGPVAGTIREAAGGFSLSLSSGPDIPLRAGSRVTAGDILSPGGATSGSSVAEVVCNTADTAVLGLKNQSGHVWSAMVPGGGQRQVDRGRSIRLAAGTRINFGAVEGEIRTNTP